MAMQTKATIDTNGVSRTRGRVRAKLEPMELDPRMQSFLAALEGDAPPAGMSGPLRGCFHALRGEWDAAHDAVQGDSEDDAWVHAALQRDEGDHANAGYWYRRAGRAPATGAVRREYLEIAAELLRREADA